jgi:hypothetical protein
MERRSVPQKDALWAMQSVPRSDLNLESLSDPRWGRSWESQWEYPSVQLLDQTSVVSSVPMLDLKWDPMWVPEWDQWSDRTLDHALGPLSDHSSVQSSDPSTVTLSVDLWATEWVTPTVPQWDCPRHKTLSHYTLHCSLRRHHQSGTGYPCHAPIRRQCVYSHSLIRPVPSR